MGDSPRGGMCSFKVQGLVALLALVGIVGSCLVGLDQLKALGGLNKVRCAAHCS
jgi:hypothetical protein